MDQDLKLKKVKKVIDFANTIRTEYLDKTVIELKDHVPEDFPLRLVLERAYIRGEISGGAQVAALRKFE